MAIGALPTFFYIHKIDQNPLYSASGSGGDLSVIWTDDTVGSGRIRICSKPDSFTSTDQTSAFTSKVIQAVTGNDSSE